LVNIPLPHSSHLRYPRRQNCGSAWLTAHHPSVALCAHSCARSADTSPPMEAPLFRLTTRAQHSLLGAALAAALLLPGIASAQVTPAAGYTPPDDTPSIKIGAVIFTD